MRSCNEEKDENLIFIKNWMNWKFWIVFDKASKLEAVVKKHFAILVLKKFWKNKTWGLQSSWNIDKMDGFVEGFTDFN